MKLFKTIILLSASMLLSACGASSASSSSKQSEVVSSSLSSESSEQSRASASQVSSSQEAIAIVNVKMDYSSLEKPEYVGAPYVYLGKEYLIKVTAYGTDSTTPLNSDQIEYRVTGNDGTTVMTDWVKSVQGEKANEFIITALPKSLVWGHFDLVASAKLKSENVWHTAERLYGVSVIEEEQAEEE